MISIYYVGKYTLIVVDREVSKLNFRAAREEI
jgi:hypothetical protein